MGREHSRGATPRVTRRTLLRGALGAALGAPPLVGALAACQSAAGPAAPSPNAAASAPVPAPAAGGAASLVLPRRQRLKVAWTAVTGAQAGLWVAQEIGAWAELGLDVELVRLGSSGQMAASLRAGELDGGVLDWALAFQFAAQGGNARQVASITNRQLFSVLSVPSITRPLEVAGKRWGITRLGSAIHTGSLVALELWGVRPEEVQFIQLQEVPAILAALQAGQIDVGTMSSPTSTRAVQTGFRELVDLAESGPGYPSVALAILDRYVDEAPDVVRAYVAGYGSGLARFRRDRALALDVLRRYLQLDDEAVLADTHARFSRYLAWRPTLPMADLPRVQANLAQGEPRLASVALADVAAPRFADELEAAGFFAGLG